MDPGFEFGCPALCQVALCSLQCLMRHREGRCAPNASVATLSYLALVRGLRVDRLV